MPSIVTWVEHVALTRKQSDDRSRVSGITCSAPVSTVIQTTVTFTGTKSNPESLVIDNNCGATVTIVRSFAGNSELNRSNTNFDNCNWGMILATGNINPQGNFVFKGFIYTPGNVDTSGTVIVQGGPFSNDDPGLNSQVNNVDTAGTVDFCARTGFLLTPQFYYLHEDRVGRPDWGPALGMRSQRGIVGRD